MASIPVSYTHLSGDVTAMVEIEYFDRIAPVQPGKETEMEKFKTVKELNIVAAVMKIDRNLTGLIELA